MKKISIFGVTGSIGQSTSKVICHQDTEYDVRAVTANTDFKGLAEQAKKLNAKKAIIADESYYDDLKELLSGSGTEVAAGQNALLEAAQEPVDWTMAAIVGMAGLAPLMESLKHSKIVAIANKEPLVSAGPVILQTAQKYNTKILPVDSEHNAVFQVFEGNNKDAIERIILTATGGPFLNHTRVQMENVTVEQAIAHPKWSMGSKISIDSATMMNKGLEVIEASRLFGLQGSQIDIAIHPECVVHSCVEYADGSILAQMGPSDMCTSISYALGWPQRFPSPGQKLDIFALENITFGKVDLQKFPLVKIAYDVLQEGLDACVAFNAANEIAVQAFLDTKIGFLDIERIIMIILSKRNTVQLNTLEDIMAYDTTMREQAITYINTTFLKQRTA